MRSGEIKISVKNSEYILEADFSVRNQDFKPIEELISRKQSMGVIYGETKAEEYNISLSRVSHYIFDINLNKKYSKLNVKCKVLNTTHGKPLRELIDDGITQGLYMYFRYVKNSNGFISKLFTIDVDFVYNRLTQGETLRNERKLKLEKIYKING